MTAANLAQNVQKGTKGAADQFNRFVEGGAGGENEKVAPEKKDFWDSFGEPEAGSSSNAAAGGGGGSFAPAAEKKSSAIGTAAMRKPGGGEGGGPGQGKKEDDGWDEF